MTETVQTKNKKPAFIRRDAKITGRVKANWRKPRGKHSPVRQKHKGRVRMVSIGFGADKKTKGFNPTGLQEVIINNISNLESIDPKKEGVVLSSTIGKKNRIVILKEIIKKEIPLLNIKDAQKYLETIEKEFQAKTATKKKKTVETPKTKEKPVKEDAKPKEKEEETPKEKVVEEKKKEEKKIMEKTIIKKQ